MEPDRRQRIQAVALEALALAVDERAGHLEAACAGDGDLRRDVDSLLEGQAQASAIFDTPPWAAPSAPLRPGTRLGPYEIDSAIGAGGMGDVYKAKDTRLGRAVAIKVLPPGLASDPERRRRFEQEARAVSVLNHPHICALHDIGSAVPSSPDSQVPSSEFRVPLAEPLHYLVLEYLAGTTLAQRLKKGRLPLDEALRVATEIADALSAAHRHGIIHRDLKPGNVMLTKSGARLLDFGLAKLTGHGSAPAVTPRSPSSSGSAPLTGEGTIIGTLPYMAPEQIGGREADARSDIWAFGCLLHEMLTGRRPFEGTPAVELVGAILRGEPPPVSSIQKAAPPLLDRLVRTCLAKDPDDRWQDAHDLLTELKFLAELDGTTPAASRGTRLQGFGRRSAVIGASVLAGVALASAWWLLRTPPTATTVNVHAAIPLAPGSELFVRGYRRPIEISPDGKRLAYVARSKGVAQIHVRSLDGRDDVVLADGTGPFFSADGRWIGYFSATDRSLKKAALTGGAPVTICQVRDLRGASWGPDNQIVFAFQSGGGLMRVPADGGTAVSLTTLDQKKLEKTHRYPHLLPDGRGVIFTVGTNAIDSFDDARIAVYEFATRRTTVLLEGGMDARYVAPGYLVYGHKGALMAVRFDPDRLQVSGPPVHFLDGVMTSSEFGWAAIGTSAGGLLAYAGGGDPRGVRDAVWVDRVGRPTPAGVSANLIAGRLSRDGGRLALLAGEANNTLWIKDFQRNGLLSRLAIEFEPHTAIWSPDGRRIICSSNTDIRSVAADGSGDDDVLIRDLVGPRAYSMSPDGATIVYNTMMPETGMDICAFDMRTRTARPILSTKAAESFAQISPDGRWMAYVSNESGRNEVYVRAFPALGARYPVSRAGGTLPVWAPGGRELYLRSGSAVYLVHVQTAAGTFSPGDPLLVPTPPRTFMGELARDAFDVSSDGRLLMFQDNTPPFSGALNIVSGWLDELARRVPLAK